MYRLGFEPTEDTVTAFANTLQLTSDIESILKFLDVKEREIEGLPVLAEQDADDIRNRMLDFFYVAVSRRLSDDGRDEEALQVASQYLRRHPTTARHSVKRLLARHKKRFNRRTQVARSSMSSSATADSITVTP